MSNTSLNIQLILLLVSSLNDFVGLGHFTVHQLYHFTCMLEIHNLHTIMNMSVFSSVAVFNNYLL